MAKKLREIVVAVTADTGAYQREMNRQSRMGGEYFKSVEQGAKRADAAYQRNAASIRMQVTAMDEATQSVAAYTRAIAAAFSAGKLVSYADSWTNLNNRLKLVTDGAGEFTAAQTAVFNIAQNARAPLQATAELYQRIATNQDALGLSGQGVASIVDTISKTMVISGASTQAADAALVQLGQAFASGTLRGEELNSVMEQTPALAKAIADGLGIPIGELRALGATGQLTAQQVVTALQKMAGSVDTQFSKMQVTVSQSLTVLNNEITKWIGQADEATGASKALADGIISLSKNLDTAAAVAGGVAVVALGRSLGQASSQAFQATQAFMANRAALIDQARAQSLAAEAGLRKAQLDVFLAEKEAVAARGTAVQTQMAIQLAQARAVERGATEAASAATARYAAVSNTAAAAGRAVLGFLGGPVGLAITVATAAAGWLLFRDNTDSATKAMQDMTGPLDELVKKYGELNAQQRDQARRGKQSQLADATSDMQSQVARLSEQARAAATQSSFGAWETFRDAIAAINADTSLSAQKASEQIQAQIEAYVKATPVGAAYRAVLVDIAAEYSKSRAEVERYTGQLKAMDGVLAGTAATAQGLGESLGMVAAGMNKADWEKYLKNLEAARDLVGMSAKEAGEYKARAEGANDAQAKLAGTLAQQADTAEALKKATADKDQKAIDGAKATLQELIKVEAQQRAIIAAAAEAARLQGQLAKGVLTAEGFNQMVSQAYENTYQRALDTGAERTATQFSGIAANTEVKRTGKKSGDDWAKWVKERQAETAAQLDLAAAYLEGGAAVEKATQAKRIEEEVLKQGAKRRAEIVSLLDAEAQARAKADAAKQIADMGKEIALIDAKTEAERILWETQNGSYAALDENIRKALVGRARELDLARKAQAQQAYIGQVSGRTEADETLEKMGWLADAFDRNQLSAEQYKRALGELTGEGLGSLTEFAVQGARNIQSYLGDGLYQAVTGKFEGIGNAFFDMLARMATEAAAANLGEMLFGSFGKTNQIGGLFGAIGGAIGGMFGGGSSMPSTASWAMPKFAKGGAFTNGVVDSPVAFPMGLMGEAGPEAIMPLHRGADGSLGVRAEFPSVPGGGLGGGGFGGMQVNINVDRRGETSSNSSDGGEDFERGLAAAVQGYVQQYVPQEIQKSFRPGGSLWNAQQNRRP
ncbi:tape measure protein [Achromobacter xylosoxidans]